MKRTILAGAAILAALSAVGCAPAADEGRMQGCHWSSDFGAEVSCPKPRTVAPSTVPNPLTDAASLKRAAWDWYNDALTDGCRADFDRSYRGVFWDDPSSNQGGTFYVRLAPYRGACE
jgi:hypothetical protein